ncbi:unnamed protein product [Ectocarpus fasciculatus]
MVTDEGVSFRFELDNVELPSHHWEWVGGWMVDSETESSSDQDGWIYGRSPSDISEIALGRKSSYSKGMRSSSSSSSPEISSSAAGSTSGAAGVGDGTRAPEARPENTHDGDESPASQQQQQQQQQRLGTGNFSDGDIVSSAENKTSEDSKGPRRQETATAIERGGGGGPGLRRRRLVRLRMVRMVDGARDSTTSVLEMIRRLSSMEILVRKLSRQVVTQQRQMTALESQVAFLAPLQPKLRMACALGKKDRLRGDALQRKLIEADNELKVLRRCMDATAGPASTGARGPAPPPPLAPATSRHAKAAAPAPLRAAVPGGRNAAENDGVSARRVGGDGGVDSAGSQGAGVAGGGGAAAWGWVEGVAQRAVGTLARRGRTAEPPEEGVGGEQSGAVTFRPAGRGDAGTLV